MRTSSHDPQELIASLEYFIRYMSGIQDATQEICHRLDFELKEHEDWIGEFYSPVEGVIHNHRVTESDFHSSCNELKVLLENDLATYRQFFSEIDKLVEADNEEQV